MWNAKKFHESNISNRMFSLFDIAVVIRIILLPPDCSPASLITARTCPTSLKVSPPSKKSTNTGCMEGFGFGVALATGLENPRLTVHTNDRFKNIF